MKEVSDLTTSLDIDAIVWPLVIGAALVIFQRPLRSLLGSLQLTKLTIPDVVSAEFQVPSQEPLDQNILGRLRDPNTVSANISDRVGWDLAKRLEASTPLNHAIIDLGEGKEWLTSRLYIAALLLDRMRSLQALVFVATDQDVPRHFVGWAEPSKVRWALAHRHKWLEEAFSSVYESVVKNPDTDIKSTGELAPARDTVAVHPATTLLRVFLEKIQTTERNQTTANEEEWESIGNGTPLFEHGEWLCASKLKRFLGDALTTSCEELTVLYGKSHPEQARIILRHRTPYVAVARDAGRFDKLLDRQPLLEEVAHNCLRES